MKKLILSRSITPLVIAIAGWITLSGPPSTADEAAVSRWITLVRDPASRQENFYAFEDALRGTPSAVPQLLQALGDSDSSVRRAAAAALGEVTADPKEIIPPLIE